MARTTLARKVTPAQERRIVEALTRPSFELSPETPTVTWRALITHGLAFHGELRERVLDERGWLVRSHGVMLTDAGVAEARRLAGDSTITREDVARGAEDALQWLPRSAREEWAAKTPAEVLGREFKRAGRVWRSLAKEGGRVPVELQALEHYNRVQDLLRAARRFEQEDAAEEAERTPEGAEDGRAVGFYVYVRNGQQRGFLLGPYATKAEADDNVSRARRYAEDQVAGACFYEYGSARAVAKPGRALPMGKFNDRIGLRAEEGETMTEESTPVERVKHSKTAAGVLESLRAPGIGHGDAGDPDEQQAARAAAVADLADEDGTCRGGEDRRPCETAMSGGECEHTEAAEQARARAAAAAVEEARTYTIEVTKRVVSTEAESCRYEGEADPEHECDGECTSLEGDVRELEAPSTEEVTADADDLELHDGDPVAWATEYIRTKTDATSPSSSPIGDAAREHEWLSGTYADPYDSSRETHTTVRLTGDWTEQQRAQVFTAACQY